MAERAPRRPPPPAPQAVVILPPGATEVDRIMFQKLMEIEQGQASLLPLLEKMLAHLAAQAQPPKTPVASYAQLYPALQEVPAPRQEDENAAPTMDDQPPQRGGWGRLFPRRPQT